MKGEGWAPLKTCRLMKSEGWAPLNHLSLLELVTQNNAGGCQQTFCFQKFVDNAQ